jgi:hypothetical protein
MPTPRKSKRERTVETLRRDPRPVLYANHAQITITPWDFGFQFGQVIEASEERLKAQEEICIYMSPQHAKVFLSLVDRLVKVYEEKYGTIPEPKGTKGGKLISLR